MTDFSQNLRRRFADTILVYMDVHPNIYVITADLGYRMWDQVRQKYPDRFINVGAAEQSLIGIAIGLALEGKIPIVYSITPFLLYRPFETIRNYVNHESIPIKLIGAGRNDDYQDDGFSHHALEDKEVMKLFPNIQSFWPETVDELSFLVKAMINDNKPWYINLKR